MSNQITHVTIVRHGQTHWNNELRLQGWKDEEGCQLTKEGLLQARALGARFEREKARFDIVYCSDLGRALTTMQLAIERLNIKPSNIMLDREGHIKVMDFGLATTRREDLVLVCGTPEYIPPEVLLSKSWNAHTLDRYALGILIYRMIHGVTPYEGENAKSVFFNI